MPQSKEIDRSFIMLFKNGMIVMFQGRNMKIIFYACKSNLKNSIQMYIF